MQKRDINELLEMVNIQLDGWFADEDAMQDASCELLDAKEINEKEYEILIEKIRDTFRV